MRVVSIPGTGLTVSSVCLGTADIGSTIDRETSFRMLDMFVDMGGSFVDTASVYADWRPGPRSCSEKTIGEWLERSGKRERVVLATKGAHPRLESMDVPRMSREEILHDAEASLRNLRTDVIDVYWLHRNDVSRPVGDILDVLEELVRAGKIRAYGCSNWRVARIIEAQAHAADNGMHGFCADQMRWSPASVDTKNLDDPTTVAMDDALYELHARTGMAAVPYSSQAGGLFQKMAAGRAEQMPAGQWRMYGSGENRARYVRIRELCERLSTSITGIVLAYMQSHPFVTTPIVGCRTPAQLEDSLGACDVRLSEAEVAFLEGRAESPESHVRV